MTAVDVLPPRISVVMPCFNGAAHLLRSVMSALGQTFGNLELIVVDDGSTDDSRIVLAGIDDARLRVIAQANQGVSAARNAGIAAARGEYIAFLDADDTWEPDCLQALHEAIVHAGADIAYCGWQNVGLSGGRGAPYVPPDYEAGNKLLTLFENCPWPIHACLARRALVVQAGGFQPGLKTSEDYLLWLRAGKDHKLVRVPRVLAYYHFHDGAQATRDRARLVINHFQVQRRFLRECPADARRIGAVEQRKRTYGQLLHRGMEAYWAGDLPTARRIFRFLMGQGFFSVAHAKYLLPSWLPQAWQRRVMQWRSGSAA